MDAQEQERWDGGSSLLGAAIGALDLAKGASHITPAKAVLESAGVLLTMIRVCFLFCNDSLRIHT